MMKKRVCVKVIAVLLFCTVLTGGLVSMPSYKAEAVTQQELEDRLNDLKDEEARIASELKKAKNDVANQQAYQTQLSYQINNTENQITALSQRIGVLKLNRLKKKLMKVLICSKNGFAPCICQTMQLC